MSFNRLAYDTCSYKKYLEQSVAPIDHMLDPSRFEHRAKCANQMGLVAGPQVSHIKGNMVDLESDLRGITRTATSCPEYKHKPIPGNEITRTNYGGGPNIAIDTTPMHLQTCQMVDYRAIPDAGFASPFKCKP